jgi:hypothetical protein
MAEKKPRKTRKDKGVKRGKKGIKNPRLQIGSIDFRTIGTQQTFGQPNITSLIGTMASLARPVIPQYLQPQVSTELANYAPRDLPKNIPPPQFRPDVEQGQEEQSEQVRRAMGGRIARLRKEEASLVLKKNQMEETNMMMGEELRQKQMEIVEQDKSMDLKRKSFIVEQIYQNSAPNALARIHSQITGENITADQASTFKGNSIQELNVYRNFLMEQAGLNPELADSKKVKVGERGKARKDWFYNPQKADLQRAQEESSEILVESEEE